MAADLRPGPGEYAPYYETYVARVGDGDPLGLLSERAGAYETLLLPLSEEQAGFRYAPGKWSVREVLGHVCDAERIFAYRALRIGRGDTTPLASFEEDAYVSASGADARPLGDHLAEFDSLRASTEALFRGFPPEAFLRMGTASGHPVSVRALLHIILGHAEHHLAVLRERYLALPR